MSANITPSMVQSIIIENKKCSGSFTCEHLCKIKLEDGREKEIHLFSLNISSLINQIETHKFNGDLDHFKQLKSYAISYDKFCLNTLHSIFNKKPTDN